MCKWWVQFLGKALVKFSLNCWANKVAVYSLGSLVLCAAPVTQGLGWLRRDSLERGPQPARALLRWVNRKRWVGMFLQPPCLLVPQAPNLGCLSCSVWAFLSDPRLTGHYSAAARLAPKEESEIVLLGVLTAAVGTAAGDGKTRGQVPACLSIAVVCSGESVLGLLVFTSACWGDCPGRTSQMGGRSWAALPGC